MFDQAMQKVLKNINDANTDDKTAREVRLVVKFIPGDSPGVVGTEIGVSTKLSAPKSIKTTIMYGIDGGRMVARELVRQQKLPFIEKVVPIENSDKK
jgi:hypothetical protein